MNAKVKTRFSADDLKRLMAEAEAAKETLSRLSNLLLTANLEHTHEKFYNSDVRRVSDHLYTRLSLLDALLYTESCRQRKAQYRAQEEAVA